MLQRFRSAVLRENLLLIVTGLLCESAQSEWEILNTLHKRFALTPSAKEFRKLIDFIVEAGYVHVESVRSGRKLAISLQGRELFRRLGEACLSIAARLDSPSEQPSA